jgi:hypothetical protein
MRGSGPVADLIAARFKVAVKRLGLNRSDRQVDYSQFRVPRKPGDQLSLF